MSQMVTRTLADDAEIHLEDHDRFVSKVNYQFDVHDFGAKGDSVTDDTVAIQAAVDEADSVNAGYGGGVVVFPPGKYVAENISLVGKRNVTLRGFAKGRDGATQLRIRTAGDSPLIDMGGSNDVNFKNLFLFATNAAYSGTLIDNSGPVGDWGVNGSKQVTVDGIAFNGAGTNYTAIKVAAAYSWQITRCFFRFVGTCIDGVYTTDNTNNSVTVSNCTFTSNVATALIKNPSNWIIRGNAVEPPTGGAPKFVSFDPGIVPGVGSMIMGNWCGDVTAPGTHIEVVGDGWTITGNLLHTGSGSTAIKAVGDVAGLSITGNLFYAAGTSVDFGAFDVSGVFQAGNALRGSSYAGVLPVGSIWQT